MPDALLSYGIPKLCLQPLVENAIRHNGRKIDVTGVVSLYQGSIQFSVNSYDDFRYSDNGKTLPKQ